MYLQSLLLGLTAIISSAAALPLRNDDLTLGSSPDVVLVNITVDGHPAVLPLNASEIGRHGSANTAVADKRDDDLTLGGPRVPPLNTSEIDRRSAPHLVANDTVEAIETSTTVVDKRNIDLTLGGPRVPPLNTSEIGRRYAPVLPSNSSIIGRQLLMHFNVSTVPIPIHHNGSHVGHLIPSSQNITIEEGRKLTPLTLKELARPSPAHGHILGDPWSHDNRSSAVNKWTHFHNRTVTKRVEKRDVALESAPEEKPATEPGLRWSPSLFPPSAAAVVVVNSEAGQTNVVVNSRKEGQ